MTESDLIRLIKQVVKKEFTQMLMAQITDTDNSYVTAMRRFVTDSEIDGLRVMSPYGFVSRPPSGTECLVAPINADPSHLVILNQFDNGNRPTLEDEESAMYGPMGQMIYMDSSGDINFTSYVAETGTILPTHLGQISLSGDITFENVAGGNITIASSGETTFGNLVGSITVGVSGMIELDGGGGASHGVGLGDVIEMRLEALEMALTTLTSIFGTAHTHAVISLGAPSGPPLPPADPFIAVPTPAASLTVTVST